MMKVKGPLDNTTYTTYLRQRANTKMYKNDVDKNISSLERQSIISQQPFARSISLGLLRQINKP